MSNKAKDILLEKYYEEFLDKGLTPAEAGRLANQKMEKENE
tara:strand:+ start:1792 stop:1914 length:123 start_codon:yes stop_codon:yes gene_type:complete